jgi:hypothetical protein
MWSLVAQDNTISGRMGHSSVYAEETGLIYVYGGRHFTSDSSELSSYDPICHVWTSLTPRYISSTESPTQQ